MLRNYLKVAVRSLRRRSAYPFINAVGLVSGLACCALVFLYVRSELSYDTHLDDVESVYRIETLPTDIEKANALIIRDVAAGLKDVSPEVVASTDFMPQRRVFVQNGQARFPENDIFATTAGTQFFEVFPHRFLRGNRSTALDNPNSVVLSETTSRRYFGDDDPIGQTVRIDSVDYAVTGVMEDVPKRSHLSVDVLYTQQVVEGQGGGNWGFYSYVRLRPGTDPAAVSGRLRSVVETVDSRYLNQTFGLRPVASIHLYSDARHNYTQGSDVRYIYAFLAMGLLILLVSLTNYANLSVAMYAQRALEVGVRKAIGAQRSQVISQFLTEAVLLALLSLPMSIALVALLLPGFAQLMDTPVGYGDLADPVFLLGMLGLTVFVGLVSGLHPALTLSKQSMGALFSNASWRDTSENGGFGLRRVLLVMQFTLLIAFGSATYLINQQVQFLTGQDLGIQVDGAIRLNNQMALRELGMERFEGMRNRLLSYPDIAVVSAVHVLPGNEDMYLSPVAKQGADTTEFNSLIIYSDEYVFDALGIEGITPEYFQRSVNERPGALLASVSAMQRFGFDPYTNERQTVLYEPGQEWEQEMTIHGVFEDFKFFSLRRESVPVMVLANPEYEFFGEALVRVENGSVKRSLETIEQIWYEFIPDQPFTYALVADDLNAAYSQDERFAELSIYLSIIAMIIAVMGLTALTALLTRLRAKEIVMRKVLGASTYSILRLLNREFLLLVGVAILVATPVTYLAVDRWLSDFAYHIDISLFVFMLAGFMGLLIAICTVSAQAIRVANLEPTKVLRSE